MPLDLAVGGPAEPRRQRERQRSPLRLRHDGLLRALPKQAQLILADTALHPENQAIIGQRQVIDLIEIGHERIEMPADLEQLRPVLGVAREAGGFEAQDDADMAQGHFGRHVLEAGPVSEAARRDAEVIDNGGGMVPAQRDGPLAEAELEARTLRVITNLLWTGLTDIDDGRALEMRRGDPIGHHAWPPAPRGRWSRRAGAARPTLGSAPAALGRPAPREVRARRAGTAASDGWVSMNVFGASQPSLEGIDSSAGSDPRARMSSNARRSCSAVIATTGLPRVKRAHVAASVIHKGSVPRVPSDSSQNSTSPWPHGTRRFTRALWP